MRLGGEDAAWLRAEEPESPMVVSGLLELTAPLSIDRALELHQPLAAQPRFRSIVVERRLRRPVWRAMSRFDIRNHIERVELTENSDAALREFVGRTVSLPLDRRSPLWQLHVIDRPGAGTLLLYRVHHAVADGFALLDVLLSLCDRGVFYPRVSVSPRRTPSFRGTTNAIRRLAFLRRDPDTSLKRPLGATKRVAWTAPIELSELKRIAHSVSATLNDVIVALVAGGLARYLARRGERTRDVEIHAMVPVNLRPRREPITVDNRFGLVMLGLPLGIDDPLARVDAVKDRMSAIKGTAEARLTHSLLCAAGWAPRSVEAVAASFFANKVSVVLTNVPGPTTKLSLAGIPVSRIVFWVPQAARLGLGISILSYAGAITVGVIADDAVVPEPERLVADLQTEAAALRAETA